MYALLFKDFCLFSQLPLLFMYTDNSKIKQQYVLLLSKLKLGYKHTKCNIICFDFHWKFPLQFSKRKQLKCCQHVNLTKHV